MIVKCSSLVLFSLLPCPDRLGHRSCRVPRCGIVDWGYIYVNKSSTPSIWGWSLFCLLKLCPALALAYRFKKARSSHLADLTVLGGCP